jgi:hypothetical protein
MTGYTATAVATRFTSWITFLAQRICHEPMQNFLAKGKFLTKWKFFSQKKKFHFLRSNIAKEATPPQRGKRIIRYRLFTRRNLCTITSEKASAGNTTATPKNQGELTAADTP